MKTLALTLLLLGSSLAHAQTNAPAAAPKATNSGSDKLDIKKLEQKYWSAKDDDFAVVQNRTYTKAKRYFLSVNAGVPFNDPFVAGTLYGANFGYFFNERWGLDVEYKSGSLKDNDATALFQSRYGVYPDHNVFQSSQILSGT
ncbi:MAG: outer membrane beta-barrel domain-containing protein, partial [Bdellovibrionaceae bacterium]|nr:outer membrane beta-barrel domain-containing protein [Pseudobdellovibrionaceae bacterium]